MTSGGQRAQAAAINDAKHPAVLQISRDNFAYLLRQHRLAAQRGNRNGYLIGPTTDDIYLELSIGRRQQPEAQQRR